MSSGLRDRRWPLSSRSGSLKITKYQQKIIPFYIQPVLPLRNTILHQLKVAWSWSIVIDNIDNVRPLFYGDVVQVNVVPLLCQERDLLIRIVELCTYWPIWVTVNTCGLDFAVSGELDGHWCDIVAVLLRVAPSYRDSYFWRLCWILFIIAIEHVLCLKIL